MNKIKFILLTALCLGSISAACCAEEIRDSDLSFALDKINTVYGITLHYAEGPASPFPDLNYTLVDLKDTQALKKIILLFAQEISLYPKDFFRHAGCQNVFFVQKLFYKQIPVDGLFSAGTNYIFYDYRRGRDNTQKIRHYIHHEFYHMIASKHPFWKEHGPAWEALNQTGFSYNEKYSPHGRNPINYYAPDVPGFVTEYAMASAEEDRAEVFACMMLPEQRKLMEKWAQKDTILFKKVGMMKEFLKQAF